MDTCIALHFLFWDYQFFYHIILPDISFATCPPVPVEIIMAQGVSIFQGEQYLNRCPCCFSAAVSCLSSRCHTVFVTTVVTINFWCWNVISIKHAQPQSVHFFACYVIYDTTIRWSQWGKVMQFFTFPSPIYKFMLRFISYHQCYHQQYCQKCNYLHFFVWYHH